MQVSAIPPQQYEGGHPISGCQRDGGDRDTVPHLVVLRRRAHIRGSSKNGRDNPSIRRRTTLGGSAPQVPTGRSCKASPPTGNLLQGSGQTQQHAASVMHQPPRRIEDQET